MPWLNRREPLARRRAAVFLLAFLPAAVGALIYVYIQPPEYRAAARLQITPAAAVAPATEATNTPVVATDAQAFLTETQVLTSRPVLQDAVRRLASSGELPDLGPDPVAAAERMLHAEPIEGTEIVRLWATGPQPQFVAHLVNAVADAYRQHVAAAYQGLETGTYGQVEGEVRALEDKIAVRRDALDGFAKRYDIVSMQRQENGVLAEIGGLSKSYTEATQRLAKAQGRLDALKAGKAVVRAKDDPTFAALQQRLSVLRGQWREMQDRFTPAYLALDPDAKSIEARLDDLEQQLKAQAGAGERAAFAEAQQDLYAAQIAVDQLRKRVADNQNQAQEFATHLNQYRAMRQDLDHLEGIHRAALDRLAKLQASERERAPRVALLEAAAASRQPWRPDYPLEAALAVGGSLIFGLFATWFVDFIAGPRPQAPSFVQYSWTPALMGPGPASAPPLLASPDMARLPPPEPPPRALTDAEITALLAAATEDARLIAVALLTGLAIDEIVALRWQDIDFGVGVIRIGGEAARVVPLDEPMRSLLTARQSQQQDAADTALRQPDGGRPTREAAARLVLFAAYDAGLDRPQDVTPEALRYTYMSFLLRQGIRAADIERFLGRVPQAELVAGMQLHSPATRRPIAEIERLLPALREFDWAARAQNSQTGTPTG